MSSSRMDGIMEGNSRTAVTSTVFLLCLYIDGKVTTP
jgi:hypothetical protein